MSGSYRQFFLRMEKAASPKRAVQPEAKDIAQRKRIATVEDIRSRLMTHCLPAVEGAVILKQQRIAVLKVKVAGAAARCLFSQL